ncbi:hypothetical protein BKA69DRAFT_208631 [Paraphysoderma sedebokerense]|nr:hypothetical protein BKA69DRAFT_208631 [Paraphysoderma sedebokerense]
MLRNCDMTVESAAVELPPLTIAQIQRAQATFEEMHVSPHEREYTCPNSKCEFPTIKTKQYTGNKYFCWQCLKPVHSFCGHVYEKHEQSSARVCFSCIPDNSSDIPTDISPLPYEKATTFRIFEPKPSSNAVTTSQQLEEGEGSLRDVLNSPGFQTLNEADDPDLMDQCREDVEDFNHKVHDPEYLQVGETEDEEFETSEDDTDPDTEDTEAENYVDLTDEDRWYEGIENLGEEEKEILREQRLQELKNSFYDDYETVRRDKGKSTQFYERLKFTRFCQKRKFADVYVTEFKLAAYCKDLEEHRVQRKIGEKVVFELYSYSSIKKAVFAVVRWWKQQSNTVEAMANSPNPYTHAIQTFMQNYMYKDMKRRATSKTLDIIRNTILDSRLTDDEINRILFTCMDKRQCLY